MTQVASPEAIRAPLESNSIVGGGRRFETRVDDDGLMWIDVWISSLHSST
jgi:hypothetical protein